MEIVRNPLELKLKNGIGTKTISSCALELRRKFADTPIAGGIVVLKSEWTNKSTPGTGDKTLGRKITVRTLEDNSGWVVIRKG